MPTPKLTALLARLCSALDPDHLTAIGVKSGFLKRERAITPAALIPCLVSALGSGSVETLADLARAFGEFGGTDVSYKAFYDRISQEEFPKMMQCVFEHLGSQLIGQSLRFLPSSPFSRFRAISIQDGTSFALHDALKEHFPGRFTKIKPSAVEIHTTYDLLSEAPSTVTVSPDTHGERQYLPDPVSLLDTLLLADRGYVGFAYMDQVRAAGGFFVIRGKSTHRSMVLAEHVNGELVPSQMSMNLPELLASRPDDLLDLQVQSKGYPDFRLVVSRRAKETVYLWTNLPSNAFPPQTVLLAYRLRWQIELLFKEWKSYANLHAFVTRDPNIAEGLIWASLCAAVLKRFLAQAAQNVGRVAVSTRKAAMILGHRLVELLRQVSLAGEQPLTAFKEILDSLVLSGKRSHPKRERRIGRLQLSLRPRFGA